jgi:hypothetical protein
MEHRQVPVGVCYTIRKNGGEINVSLKAVNYVGGVEGIAQRLVAIWLDMPEHYRSIGLHWYDEASEFAQDLATVYGLSLWQVAQVIAVLSPQNPWNGSYTKEGIQFKDGNRLCTIKVIKAWIEGGAEAVRKLKGWGYAPEFVERAIRVLQGQELDWSTAPKTHRFALLIADPKREDIAVIDSHASRIATGNLGGKYHVVAKAAYKPLEKAYMLAASVLGIPAYVLQAGTWQFAVDGNLY